MKLQLTIAIDISNDDYSAILNPQTKLSLLDVLTYAVESGKVTVISNPALVLNLPRS